MKFNNIPITIKITIWFSILMILIVGIMFIFMFTMSDSMIEFNLQNKLKRTVDYVLDEVEYDDGKLEIDNDVELFDDGIYLLVYDLNGNLLLGDTPGNMSISADFDDGNGEQITVNNTRYFIYDRLRTFKKHDNVWVRGLTSVSSVANAMNSFLLLSLIISPVLIIFAIAGGYYIAAKSFMPIKKIINTVNEINEGSDLSKRINLGNGGDEIHKLANTFDNMFTRLETSFESEKQFTQDASHELRTPISVILAQCEYTLEYVNSIDEYKESIVTIKRQADKMSRLTSQLLTFARLDNNKFINEFENVNFSELLDMICDDQQLLNPDIHLTSSIKPNLFVFAERILLSRLCVNLISNAFTYNRKNGNVYVSLTESNDMVIFSVQDDGIGISEINLPRIWNRFFRVNKSRTSTDKENLGLGLSMVKWISDLHGGILSVDSKFNEGSTFIFKIPKKTL